MTREPVVFLPGLVCDAAVWERQVAAISTRRECVVAEYDELDSIPAMAQRVLSAAPSRFCVAGHSMGGRVALEILRAAPQRVARLALLDTGYQARPEGEAGEEEARKRGRLLDLAVRLGMRAMGLEWVQGMVHPLRLRDAPLMDAILAMIERKSVAIFAAQIRALLDRPSADSLLARIRVPTLILCGREDAWSPLARHQDMASAISGARLAIVDDCGHMSTMERPAEVLTALETWLDADA